MGTQTSQPSQETDQPQQTCEVESERKLAIDQDVHSPRVSERTQTLDADVITHESSESNVSTSEPSEADVMTYEPPVYKSMTLKETLMANWRLIVLEWDLQ